MQDKIKELEHKIRILEEENAQLTERAEDSLLLGLISENIEDSTQKIEVIENVLEQISILKNIPFCSCAKLQGTMLIPMATYAAFSNQENIGFPIMINEELIQDLKFGPYVTDKNKHLNCCFPDSQFTPTTTALFPFKTQSIPNAVFMFMDNSGEEDYFPPMLMLLNRAIDMAVAKYDILHLLSELTDANDKLEQRVRLRTDELTSLNETLKEEVAQKIRSEAALTESQQTLTTVLKSIDASVYVADMETHELLFSNQESMDAAGKSFCGEFCDKKLKTPNTACTDCPSKKLLNPDGTPADAIIWEGENVLNNRWYINHDRAIHWTDGRIVHLRISTDITSIKQIEAQLNQAQKMESIGRLAGGVAHDFNNLLMGIQGRASLLEADFGNTNKALLEHTQAIEEYIDSAAKLTSQLLGFARGGKYNVQPLNINALLNDTAAMFGRTHKEIQIEINLNNPAPIISVDRSQLEQVLLNIFINAWHAMPKGGMLLLSTEIITLDNEFCKTHQLSAGPYAQVCITDTGIGMTAETLEKIFDPFYTTKETGRGTGLGLASAYGIIKNHSGLLSATSTLNKGSTFNILLPLSDKEIMPEEKTEKPKVINGKETILLIDDEEFIITIGEALLTQRGYKVLTAKSGKQALKLIEEDQPETIDLVLMDMIMPGMTGEELFNTIHSLRPQLPVILSSGYSRDEKIDKIISNGCNGFIKKPYTMANLSQKIRGTLSEQK